MPLPHLEGAVTDAHEENYYMHLLAQISLSRLISRIVSFQTTYDVYQALASYEQSQPSESTSEAQESDPRSLSFWTSELGRQLDEWRVHLPDALQWNNGYVDEMPNATSSPSTTAPLFVPSGGVEGSQNKTRDWDILIATLRSKYLYAKYLIGQPVVYKALHFPDRMTQKDVEDCAAFLKVCTSK